MSNPDKLFVIGGTLDDIHRWAVANGVPWARVEPVTGANQLRTRTGQRSLTYVWADTSKMHRAVKSVINTQLSIRRCLGPVFDSTRLYDMPKAPTWTDPLATWSALIPGAQ